MNSTRISLFASLAIVLCTAMLVFQSCGSEADSAPTDAPAAPEVAQDLPPCQSVVTVKTDSSGTVLSTVLDCEGGCGQEPCTTQSITDAEGNQRRWCGCTDVEPTDCHLVFYQPKLGQPRFFCTLGCTMIPEITLEEGVEVARYTCRAQQ